ncbi:MAG: lysophospholipid acyltransferase family protein [Tepidisphaerales bacterium]
MSGAAWPAVLAEADPLRRSLLWRTLQPLAKLAFATLFDLRAYGVENVPQAGGAVLAANHQSFLDPPVIAAPLTRPVSFMAKAELFSNPYFGMLIRNLHAYPIRQGRGDRGAIVETVKRLEEGYLVNIYPEGSRTEDGELQPLQPGLALVVRRAKVPVVPVAIEGSFAAWPRGRAVFRPSPVTVAYGPALRLHELPAEQATGVLAEVLRAMLEELRHFPHGRSGRPRWTVESPAPRELLWSPPGRMLSA